MDNSVFISGYEFDLTKSVYLHNPNNKFWKVQIDGKTVTYRAGKLKDS